MRKPTISIPAFRSAIASGQTCKISAGQLRILLDAYEAAAAAVPPDLVVHDVACISLAVVVPTEDVERLRKHRSPVFAYDLREISEATGVSPAAVKTALREGTLRPGRLKDVIELSRKLKRRAKKETAQK